MKTVRRRSGQVFVGLRASLTRGDLDQQAQNVTDAYVQWESQPLTLSNGVYNINNLPLPQHKTKRLTVWLYKR